MKSQCPISGITWETHSFPWLGSYLTGKEGKVEGGITHPIFQMPPRILLTMAGKWSAQTLDENESKLLYLALLNASELVQFKSPATPSMELISKTMELVLTLVSWKTNSSLGNQTKIRLPEYVVRYPYNHTLSDITLWLDKVFEYRRMELNTRSDSAMLRMTSEERLKARLQQSALERLIHMGASRNKNSDATYIRWALSACGVTESDPFYDNYTRLYLLKEPEIYNTILTGENTKLEVQLNDLKELLEEKLQATYSESSGMRLGKVVLTHIRNLILIHSKGPMAYYGIDDVTYSHDTAYLDKLREASIDAPAEQPIRSNYPNVHSYMKDQAKWVKAQEYIRLKTEHENDLKKKFQERLLGESYIQEDNETDSNSDNDDIKDIIDESDLDEEGDE